MNPADWIPPTYTDLRTAHFKLHPFRCDDCGAVLNFKNPNFRYRAPGKQTVMLHGSSSSCLCGPCLAKRIEKWFSMPESEHYGKQRKIGECCICNEEKLVATIIWDDWASCRFGSNWWNGHWICCDCLTECARFGTPDSSIGGISNGNAYSLNEVGARIG